MSKNPADFNRQLVTLTYKTGTPVIGRVERRDYGWVLTAPSHGHDGHVIDLENIDRIESVGDPSMSKGTRPDDDIT